jgi:D-cysteine desulfhydrase
LQRKRYVPERVMKQPPRLSLARLPTPLEPLERLSREYGKRIWVKRDDLTDTAASGNKMRKLEFTIAQALETGANVLVTCGSVQSNHCRATAVMAAKLGLKSHLILRGREPDQADGNLLLDQLVGAQTSFVTAAEYANMGDLFARLSEEYASNGDKAYMIPVGASDEIGLWGYLACCDELKNDFAEQEIRDAAIVSATGSGGTLGGLILGNQIHGLDAEIVAFNVCDDEAYFVQKITGDFERWAKRYEHPLDLKSLPISIIEGYVGPGYGHATSEVFETIRKVAALEGIILDPVYTGKAFNGMLKELNNGRFDHLSDIVFIHTGGIFGLFPQRAEVSG